MIHTNLPQSSTCGPHQSQYQIKFLTIAFTIRFPDLVPQIILRVSHLSSSKVYICSTSIILRIPYVVQTMGVSYQSSSCGVHLRVPHIIFISELQMWSSSQNSTCGPHLRVPQVVFISEFNNVSICPCQRWPRNSWEETMEWLHLDPGPANLLPTSHCLLLMQGRLLPAINKKSLLYRSDDCSLLYKRDDCSLLNKIDDCFLLYIRYDISLKIWLLTAK